MILDLILMGLIVVATGWIFVDLLLTSKGTLIIGAPIVFRPYRKYGKYGVFKPTQQFPKLASAKRV